MVPNLTNFISERALALAQAKQSEVVKRYEKVMESGRLSLQARETLGLDFVEELVEMFLQGDAMEEAVECLSDKKATHLDFLCRSCGSCEQCMAL